MRVQSYTDWCLLLKATLDRHPHSTMMKDCGKGIVSADYVRTAELTETNRRRTVLLRALCVTFTSNLPRGSPSLSDLSHPRRNPRRNEERTLN
ncbi:PREDICTED: uncharacterized protein LOC105560380 isoform X2 [Vollenhovia emeryi]|uniref:uncharacterized protein LOC105560380 isoform X2 n=1 Tax=Vollenhovia emeryi TaxID=411798 RepID=UPI0005F4979C|nr:PREDICTED: uncharacterized protein LOC105560380 isoform X2 [Vollenhovia emeryi]